MVVIGITGPTGAGKTTALAELEKLGGARIDCDAIYHNLLKSDIALQEMLCSAFGRLTDADGVFDRKKLGQIVFRDPAALDRLGSIVWPYVNRVVRGQLEQAEKAGCPAAAVDGIAIIESGLADGCDVIVGVLAPVEERVRRICLREGIAEDYARSRIAAQKEDAFFRANCTHILFNDCADTGIFACRARALFEEILTQHSKGGLPHGTQGQQV